ncbi:Alpha-L-fucosidase [Planctomycetes bacterium CA13]|uniref:alpha-L-fucosidase n=1 Tax=Novipirellula herctigrandis TaxID=2527986 RepID=A0A5C5YVR5_9BACT|nr:Alpha-L-fucosidase [Planctomycetes bacterium CA13]
MSQMCYRNVTVAIGLLVAVTNLPADETANRIKAAQQSEKASLNFDTEGFTFDIAEGPFEAASDSFGKHYECPDWFRDAKFGIYSHWGLCTVPGFDGHYGRFLYTQHEPQAYRDDQKVKRRAMSGYKPGKESVYEYHVKNFGHPSQFGYKDFIPLWKAEKFEPMKLAELFSKVGAKYFGVMAVHHDNFDNYDSTYNDWNSVKMGPKRDIVGEWKTACEANHLRFAVTSHLSNQGHEHVFFQGESDTTGPLKGVPYDTMDPANDGLYGYRTPDRLKRLNPRFARQWYLRTKDLIDKYDPDLLYLDGGLPNGDYGLNLAAHYYNLNMQRNSGKLDGVFAIKRTTPQGLTLDLELHGLDKIREQPWQTDTSINPGWFYMGKEISAGEKASLTDDAGMGGTTLDQNEDLLRLDAGKVIDNLVDIVSKNGNMLLNVGLRADGSLPKTYRDELLKIGDWLQVNGEGIYGSRPYLVYGEGPFQMPTTGHQFNDNTYEFTGKDIRFTTKGDTLYAFLMAYPNTKEVLIKSLSPEQIGKQSVRSVTMLGSDDELEFQLTENGLSVTLPPTPNSEYSHGLRIEGLTLSQ